MCQTSCVVGLHSSASLIQTASNTFIFFFVGESYDKACSNPVYEFYKTFYNHDPKPLLLIELGNINSYNKENEKIAISLHTMSSDIQTVVSLSSGGATFLKDASAEFKKIMCSFSSRPTCQIKFNPFNEEEFKHYLSLHREKYKLDDAVYRSLTNYNPLLLLRCSDCKKEADAEFEVERTVRMAVDSILKSLDTEKFVWIKNTLPKSLEMLDSAYNHRKISISELKAYKNTWLCTENVTYISYEYGGFFKLEINFPLCFDMMMNQLFEHMKDNNKIMDSAVQGYMFEQYMSESEKLDIFYSERHDALNKRANLRSATFKFTRHVSQSENSAISGLSIGCLYKLRPYHPVIDNVAYVIHDKQPWLVLIQVSLLAYKAHKSNIADLFSNITGCEQKYLEENLPVNSDMTWLDYYIRLVPEEARGSLKCVYVYISPLNFIQKEETVEHQMNLRPQNSQEVFLGFVSKGSCTEKLITLNLSKCRCS